jgi:DNA polymerase III epsilon subunit-like protein
VIVNYWPSWFRQLYGGAWPRTYCCVDTETTGYVHTQDVVTEWGHCLVEDGKVVDQLSLVVDWTEREQPPEFWVREQLRRVKQSMEMNGKPCHMTFERMKAEGMKPEKAFAFITKFTDRLKARGVPFVLHNHNFDEKMLSANFLALKLAKGFSFGDRLIDTEGIEKASQIPDNPRVHPRKSDSLRDYFLRVKYTRVTGLKSNMDPHCFTKYDFAGKHGLKLSDMHGAKTDAYCCHLLMQEFAPLITDPQTPPVYPTADTKEARRPPRATPAAPPVPAGLKRIRGQRRS